MTINRQRYVNRIMKELIGFLLMTVFVFGMFHSVHGEDGISSVDSGGTPNRSVSVDPVGKKEGFSSVLYDNTNGLPTSEANAIAETGDGFIWIGSYAGLIRYDGNTFERLDSTGGLTSIKCLFVDSRDRLWIGTNDNGVAVLEEGTLKRWGKQDGLKSAHTRDIAEDQNGTLYIATNRGISLIDKDGNLSSIEEPEVSEADMRYIYSDGNGTIYGITDPGDLMIIRDRKLVRYITAEENPLNGAGSIFPDPQNPGRIYHEAADMGLYYVDLNNGFDILEKIDIEPLRYIMSMEMIDGKIWICAGNGIGVLDHGRFDLLDNLPMDNNVGHVMTDYLGNLWFTSTRQGVMKVVPNQFSDVFGQFDLPKTVVNSTCMNEGMLFAGTDTGLIVIDENGPVSSLPLKKAVTASGREVEADDLIEFLKDCRIRSIIRDSKNRIWISTWRACGLLRYDRGELTVFDEQDGLLTNNLRSICERRDGTILAALNGGVNVIRDDSVIASFGSEDGIENIESLTVEEGFNGEIVLGTNGGGIYVISETGVRSINVEEGLSSDIVMRLKKDPKRDLIWIVTSNSIAFMTPDYRITTVEKFPYPNNFDLFENKNGDMWVLGSSGIYVLPVEELLANGEISPVFYGVDNGLPCITTANSYSELTADGDLYIAGSTGVCRVNIDVPYEDVSELKVLVPYVDADEKRIYPDPSGTFVIPSNTQKLTVYSFVLNYALTNPKVSCRLEGFDKQDITVNRSELQPLDYTNLKGGTYQFVVQLMDSMGRGNKEISVRILKEKAFYEKPWFIFLVIIAVAAVLTAAVQLYIRRRMRILERENEIAKRVAASEAKSAFLASVSHEIRTPINAVLGMNEMILRECDDDAILMYSDSIRTAGSTLLGLVNDILDFSKIEAGKMEIIPVQYDLSTVINDLVNMIQKKADDKGLKLILKISPEAPKSLYGDEVRIKQVITNILTNAVKYTEKGSVTFCIDPEKVSDDPDSVILAIAVRDTGIGIKEEDMAKLFSEFERIEEERNRNVEGTGLGMNITKHLLEMMGTSLEVRSTYGEGSVFSFRLKQKVTNWDEIGDYEAAYRASLTSRRKYREKFTAPDASILVVDDTETNLTVFCNLLKRTELKIDTAISGEEGLRLSRKRKYDVIFLDHMMPEKDGIETLHEMRAAEDDQNSGTPVICLTANAISGAREKYLSEGFEDYLSKPIDADKLEDMLIRYLSDSKVHIVSSGEKGGEEKTQEKPLPDWLLTCGALDTAEGIKNCGGTGEYLSVLSGFQASVRAKADEIEGYYRDEDIRNYTVKVHALKSSARIIGAGKLSEMARALEDAGNASDTACIKDNTEELLTLYRSYEGILAPVNETAEDLPEIPPETLQETYTALKEISEMMDRDMVLMALDSVKEYRLPPEDAERFRALKEKISQLDWDGIKNILEKIDEGE